MNESKQETGSATARKRSRHSFTLIELLVVVAIIIVLAGITLKTLGVIDHKRKTAQTLKILEQLKAGLGMFYGLKGIYPPTSGTTFERTPEGVVTNHPDNADWNQKTGLVYYLCYGDEKEKWEKYMDGVKPSSSDPKYTAIDKFNREYGYTNKAEVFKDDWGNELQYTGEATDYQSYRLWSIGRNASNEFGGGDDVGVSLQD